MSPGWLSLWCSTKFVGSWDPHSILFPFVSADCSEGAAASDLQGCRGVASPSTDPRFCVHLGDSGHSTSPVTWGQGAGLLGEGCAREGAARGYLEEERVGPVSPQGLVPSPGSLDGRERPAQAPIERGSLKREAVTGLQRRA